MKDGDNLIEIETEENNDLDTIEKLIQKVNEIVKITSKPSETKKFSIQIETVDSTGAGARIDNAKINLVPKAITLFNDNDFVEEVLKI